MPNHCTNHIRIKGDSAKVQALFRKMVKTKNGEIEGEIEIDFNAVKPMPKSIARTCSPLTVVATKFEADEINAEHAESVAAMGFFEDATRTAAITKAQEQNRLKKYGATNWYDWANRHWGTKWGAYNVAQADMVDDTTILLEFDTAWCPPDGIVSELERQGFTVDGFWHEEGGEEGEIGEFNGYVSKTIEVEWEF